MYDLSKEAQFKIDPNKLLFSAYFKLPRHSIKKNRKEIGYRFGKGTARSKSGRLFTPFIKSTSEQKYSERILVSLLQQRARSVHFKNPIDSPVWCVFRFFFTTDKFYTKKNKMSLTLGDQSNLYQVVEDSLQKASIIKSDALIRSHCLSTCLPGNETKLEIFIFPYEESPAWKLKTYLSQPSDTSGQPSLEL